MGELTAVRHPIFARIWTCLVAMPDERADAHRREVLEGLTGRVLEIGAGTGTNFAHYPPTVEQVVAVEPEQYLRGQAMKAASAASVPIEVVDGHAERLPVGDGEFDAAVFSLVLCSVPSQTRALAEAKRALKPGGELRFYEHVAARDPRLARTQRWLMRTGWSRMSGGCHLDRDTLRAIESAGFEVERIRRFSFIPSQLVRAVEPHVLGVARRP